MDKIVVTVRIVGWWLKNCSIKYIYRWQLLKKTINLQILNQQ